MDKKTFWEIIDKVNAAVDRSDQNVILCATEKLLMEYPSEDIANWYEIQRVYMDIAKRQELWAACAATESHCTDDGFIDFRSWLISQGKEIYMAALHDPDSLANLDIPAGTADFEQYGYVAYDAYTQKKALESEGLASVLEKCCRFAADNAVKIFEQCEKYPVADWDKYQQLTESFISSLSDEYDIWKEIDKQPLLEETKSDIVSEISLRPDIDRGWNDLDLPRIVPRLYEKYNATSIDMEQQL